MSDMLSSIVNLIDSIADYYNTKTLACIKEYDLTKTVDKTVSTDVDKKEIKPFGFVVLDKPVEEVIGE